ncbi:nucleotide excision repair endonuclease, partial [Klebsiella pneumoniae subsp. pneumoniae KPNIH22]
EYPEHLRPWLEALPKLPGVYQFHGDSDTMPLYIGKSVNLRSRVLSHLRTPLEGGPSIVVGPYVRSGPGYVTTPTGRTTGRPDPVGRGRTSGRGTAVVVVVGRGRAGFGVS